MIKTVPHGTISPQMMYKKYKRLVCTSPDLLARFCKINRKLVERKKLGLICFPRICFPGLIYGDQEPLWLLNVIEDDCYFSPHVRESGFRNPGIFCLWNPESWALEPGIQD